MLVGFQVHSQDSYDVKVVPIFESKLERQLITQFEHQPYFLLQSLNPSTTIYHKAWESLVLQLDQLSEKRNSNVQLLSNIFFYTHKSVLKDYTTYASFANTLAKGSYDCVTGTAVLGLLLERYGIPFTIIELEGHVYIRGAVDGIPFVMESTEPVHGLLIGKKRTEAFERKISKSSLETTTQNSNVRIGQRNRSTKQMKVAEIGLKELGGLQYYNDAVKKFDAKCFEEAYIQLIKGELLYPSPRITQFKEQLSELIAH